MEKATNQHLVKRVKPHEGHRADYERIVSAKARKLAAQRRALGISQAQVVRDSGCCLRKLQSFEAGNNYDAYLLYVYKTIIRQYS